MVFLRLINCALFGKSHHFSTIKCVTLDYYCLVEQWRQAIVIFMLPKWLIWFAKRENLRSLKWLIRSGSKIFFFLPSYLIFEPPTSWNHSKYCKIASSRLVYYSILELFGQRSQYISIKFPPHKQPCLMLRCATNRDSLLLLTLR